MSRHSASAGQEVDRSTVARIWSEALGRPVEAEDNFFALGGDSIAMMTVLYRVREHFSVDLAPAALMESPRLPEFCRLLDTALLSLAIADGGTDVENMEEGPL